MFLCLKELQKLVAESPQMKFIWGGIKDVSFGFFFGAAKTGKTIMLETLLLALAKGDQEFWGLELPGAPVKTLFISLEEHILNRAERLKKQISDLSEEELKLINENYLINDANFPTYFTNKSDWELLEKLIISSKAKVIVIDSLTRLCDKIEARDDAKIAAQKLRKLAYDNNVCIIVIHHSVKSQGKILDQSVMAGSGVLAAEADFLYGLSKTSKGERYFKEVDLRYKEESNEEVQVYKINNNACMEPIGNAKEFNLLKEDDNRYGSTLQDDLVTFIERNKKVKTSEILDHFSKRNYPERTIKYSLKAIVDAKKVTQHQRGVYEALN